MSDRFVDRAIKNALAQAPPSGGQCPEFNQVSAYIEARCGAAERTTLEQHFAECGVCREVLALCMKGADSEARVPLPGPAERRFGVRLAVPVSVAAAAVLIFGILIVQQRNSNLPVAETADLRPPAAVPQTRIPAGPPPAASPEKAEETKPVGTGSAAPAKRELEKPAFAPAESAARQETAPLNKDKAAKGAGDTVVSAAAPPAYVAQQGQAETRLTPPPAPALNQVSNQAGYQVSNQAANQPSQYQNQAANRLPEPQAALPGIQNEAVRAKAADASKLEKDGQYVSRSAVAARFAGAFEKPESAAKGFSRATAEARARLATTEIDGKTYYRWGDYWIDGECAAHADAPVVTATTGSRIFQDLGRRHPGALQFFTASAPVLYYEDGKIYSVTR